MIENNTTNKSAAAAHGSSGVTREIATSIGSKAVAWLTSKGWGATLPKMTVGAVLGAAIGIAAALGLTGCTASYSQTASGDIQYTGSIVLPVEPCKK